MIHLIPQFQNSAIENYSLPIPCKALFSSVFGYHPLKGDKIEWNGSKWTINFDDDKIRDHLYEIIFNQKHPGFNIPNIDQDGKKKYKFRSLNAN